jgi:diacylglycerol kinase family enzyme
MYFYIANPVSGNNTLGLIQEKLKKKLKSLGILGEWVQTSSPNEVEVLARAAVAKGYTTVIAVGGDDTFNEVLNGLADVENVAVGVIPIGANNRLAGRLGIGTWQQACKIIAARRLTPYSLIAAGQKYFLSSLEVGFETELDKNVDLSTTGIKARTGQAVQSWSQARLYETKKFNIDVDGRYKLSGDLFSLAVTNLRFTNQGAEDKLVLEICDHPGRNIQVNRYLLGVIRDKTSTVADREVTTRIHADSLVLKTTPASSVMVDGKIAGRTPIAIRLTDKKVRLITEKAVSDFKSAVGSD